MLLKDLKILEPKKMKLFVDNKSIIVLANYPICHGHSKHIEIMYHFFREQDLELFE